MSQSHLDQTLLHHRTVVEASLTYIEESERPAGIVEGAATSLPEGEGMGTQTLPHSNNLGDLRPMLSLAEESKPGSLQGSPFRLMEKKQGRVVAPRADRETFFLHLTAYRHLWALEIDPFQRSIGKTWTPGQAESAQHRVHPGTPLARSRSYSSSQPMDSPL